MNKFCKWLDTFIEEKGIDLEDSFEVDCGMFELMSYGCVIDAIKNTSSAEQKAIQTKLVQLDFYNADIKHFLRHLAKALVD